MREGVIYFCEEKEYGSTKKENTVSTEIRGENSLCPSSYSNGSHLGVTFLGLLFLVS